VIGLDLRSYEILVDGRISDSGLRAC
jgi:hypothetical protein